MSQTIVKPGLGPLPTLGQLTSEVAAIKTALNQFKEQANARLQPHLEAAQATETALAAAHDAHTQTSHNLLLAAVRNAIDTPDELRSQEKQMQELVSTVHEVSAWLLDKYREVSDVITTTRGTNALDEASLEEIIQKFVWFVQTASLVANYIGRELRGVLTNTAMPGREHAAACMALAVLSERQNRKPSKLLGTASKAIGGRNIAKDAFVWHKTTVKLFWQSETEHPPASKPRRGVLIGTISSEERMIAVSTSTLPYLKPCTIEE